MNEIETIRANYEKEKRTARKVLRLGVWLAGGLVLNSIWLVVNGNPIAAIWSTSSGFLVYLLSLVVKKQIRLSALLLKQSETWSLWAEKEMKKSQELMDMMEGKDAPRNQ